MAEGLHQGHRARLRARAERDGIDSLAPHEQVELLLFRAIPRRDVNPLAHRLLDRFGSLEAICAASEAELLSVKGVGPRTVKLLRDLPVAAVIYHAAKPTRAGAYGWGEIEALLRERLWGVREEQVMLLCFNGRMELLSARVLAHGTPASVGVTPRCICTHALEAGAVATVLAHSHPGGYPLPSREDRYFTQSVADALARVDVELLEHYIVADGEVGRMLSGAYPPDEHGKG